LEFTYYDERVEKEQEENLQKNEELKEGEQKPEEIEIKFKKEEEEFIIGSPEISEKTNLMQVKIDYEAKENTTVVKGESENFNITE
jgi:hypothetical protein